MATPYVGEIRLFPYNFAPLGWMDCGGQLLSIAEYEVLYVLLGTTYGGDGVQTFALPDLRGRAPIHQGQGPGLTNRVLGERAGTETVTLTNAQVPAHTHAIYATTAAATSTTPGPGLLPAAVSGDTFYVNTIAGNNAAAMSAQATTTAGGSQPHENTMPTLTARWCIAFAGIFPSQN
jgi:microcystin-dependent protein